MPLLEIPESLSGSRRIPVASSPWMWLIGAVGMGIGVFQILVGLEWLPLRVSGSPRSLLVISGVIFGSCGSILFARAWELRRADGLRKNAVVRWKQDYAWPTSPVIDDGMTAGRIYLLVFLGIFYLFLVLFHLPFLGFGTRALGSGERTLWLVGAAVFDPVFLAMAWFAVRQAMRWQRYGTRQLILDPWPARLGQQFKAVFEGGPALKATSATIELRCLREWLEPGRNPRHPKLKAECLFRETESRLLDDQGNGHLKFSLPEEPSLETHLEQAPVTYWEVVVQVSQAGPDYRGVFLLPVYAKE